MKIISKIQCTNPEPQFGGDNCAGLSSDNTNCNLGPCPIDGDWTSWSQYSGCSVSCGDGTKSRSRSCTSPPPQYGGTPCAGQDTDHTNCNLGSCPSQLMGLGLHGVPLLVAQP
eukprot:Awhi_evm1s14261